MAEITHAAVAGNPRYTFTPQAHPQTPVEGRNNGVYTHGSEFGRHRNPALSVGLQLIQPGYCAGEDIAIAIARQTPDSVVVQPLHPRPGSPLGASYPTRQAGAREPQPDRTFAIFEDGVHASQQTVLFSNGERLSARPQSDAVRTRQPQTALSIQQHLPVLLRGGRRSEEHTSELQS